MFIDGRDYFPLFIFALVAMFVVFIVERGIRVVHRRFFAFRTLNPAKVVTKLGSIRLGSAVICVDNNDDLMGMSVDCLEQEIKRFLALLVIDRTAEYVLLGPMQTVWISLVRHHKVYATLQNSVLGPNNTFDVDYVTRNSPIDFNQLYDDFRAAYEERFGSINPKIWPRDLIDTFDPGDQVMLVTVDREFKRKGPGAGMTHDPRKTVGLGQQGWH